MAILKGHAILPDRITKMEVIAKIEELINQGLVWVWTKLLALVVRLTPRKIQEFLARLSGPWTYLILKVRNTPAQLKTSITIAKAWLQTNTKFDFKLLLAETLDQGKKIGREFKGASPLKITITLLTSPFSLVARVGHRLGATHFTVLTLGGVAMFVALFAITKNSYKIATHQEATRTPASEPVEGYTRPSYYKQNYREVSFSSVKIPVYVQGINELRALMVDISILTNNRATKVWLNKNEFSLRDHLVLTVEPVLPTFPMTEEGRQVIATKLRDEISIFLRAQGVDGEVIEVRLIHILAH